MNEKETMQDVGTDEEHDVGGVSEGETDGGPAPQNENFDKNPNE